jgi:hypothetical protein
MNLREETARRAEAHIHRERAKVDDIITTANFTFIAAFVVILTLGAKPTGRAAFLPAGALSLLVVSLFAFLWHRYRHPIRLRQYEIRKAEITYEYSGKIADFMETFVRTNPVISEAIARAKVDAAGKTDSLLYQQTRDVIVAHLKNLSRDEGSAHAEAMMKPLRERGSRILHMVDVVARRLRYPAFGLGVVLLLLAVITSVL